MHLLFETVLKIIFSTLNKPAAAHYFPRDLYFQPTRKWLNNVNLSRFSTQNLFQIRACVISARKAKHLDVTTMFAYSHANTPLGQSERAYYLSYFINNCRPIGIVYIVLRRIHYLADVTWEWLFETVPHVQIIFPTLISLQFTVFPLNFTYAAICTNQASSHKSLKLTTKWYITAWFV